MGTLASELGPHVDRSASQPRIYVDANLPAPLVAFMRDALRWDVFFVMEHPDLRRARDGEHYRLARQLRRTLITLDRDYLDDRHFPPDESGGVVVLMAPQESGYVKLLRRLDAEVFRVEDTLMPIDHLPLEGRKLHVHVDWSGPVAVVPAPHARVRGVR